MLCLLISVLQDILIRETDLEFDLFFFRMLEDIEEFTVLVYFITRYDL